MAPVREHHEVVDRLRMKLASYLDDAADTARSSRNVALLARDLLGLRTRLSRAVETFRTEDATRVADELHRLFLQHTRAIKREDATRSDVIRALTSAWVDAVERVERSSPDEADVSELYAAAVADESEDDREFRRAAGLAAAERWND